jgi:hypothetical protein
MNYNKIKIYCDKYNIKRYTDFGKPLTCNKLRHIVNDHENTKNIKYHKHINYTILLNSILKMILMIMISRKLCTIILEIKFIIYYII